MSEPVLQISHLTQDFGSRRAVEDLSFSVYPGEVFALVGESGSGKTTTGRCILGLNEPTSGAILYRGRPIAKSLRQTTDRQYARKLMDRTRAVYRRTLTGIGRDKARQKELYRQYRRALQLDRNTRLTTQIQMVFQDPTAALDPRMTVRESVAEGLRIQGYRYESQISKKVDDMLELVGLDPAQADRYPHEFSGGQRQRICIARSLIVEPSLLIADEPLSSLDVSVQAQILQLLDRLRHQLGLSILFIAHDLAVVQHFSDRVGVMHRGRLLELAPNRELFAHPLHPYTRALLSAIPQPDPHAPRHRLVYDPARDHDYRTHSPALQEIAPGHLVFCNDPEAEQYRKERAYEEA